MLYSIVICVAYIIGILMGLYLDFKLSIVSFFLFISILFIMNVKIEKIIIIMVCIIVGLININFRNNDFENKYARRCILWCW